jgi:hypothetical protein
VTGKVFLTTGRPRPAAAVGVVLLWSFLAARVPAAGAGLSPVVIAPKHQPRATVTLIGLKDGPALLAAQRLQSVCRNELKLAMEVEHVEHVAPFHGRVVVASSPFGAAWAPRLGRAGVAIDAGGRIRALAEAPPDRGAQGFVAARTDGPDGPFLLLVGNTSLGLRNAVLTLCDRLYVDGGGSVVADPFDGLHMPAFERRHIKTDAMYCGPFNKPLEYWDPSSREGVFAFADWLASFRITDYELLAFARGWGLTYPSQRFPKLVNPKHPNSRFDFYPGLIDRMHAWGVDVWASDIYIASGYSMETGTVPEMLSPCANAAKLKPFVAGEGTFGDVLYAPETIACLSHPAAARHYAAVVDDLLARYPKLDGIDFHIGHMFSDSAHKICRCPACRDLAGNRDAVYRCFRSAYEAAVRRRPDLRIKTSVRMFGDATRGIEEHHREFPRLEFFCWLRWVGSIVKQQVDAPVLIGHEDGGGGLEGFRYFDPKQTMSEIREFHRGWEPVIRTYVSVALGAGMPRISWEPALQRELEQVYFGYSQLTWEPTLSWAELARRFVLRSERRLDAALVKAYQLALEANAAVTYWGLIAYGPGYGAFVRHGVLQTDPLTGQLAERAELADRSDVRNRVAALEAQLRTMGLLDQPRRETPATFDLRWSLVKTLDWLKKGDLSVSH